MKLLWMEAKTSSSKLKKLTSFNKVFFSTRVWVYIYSNSRVEFWLLFSLVAVSGLVNDHD